MAKTIISQYNIVIFQTNNNYLIQVCLVNAIITIRSNAFE